MTIAFGALPKYFSKVLGAVLGVGFLVASFWSHKIENAWLSFAMGLIACSAVFMMIADCKEFKLLNWFVKYTMPIFLMHTLFAAPCRVLLMKFGIDNAAAHVGVGIVISFAGPIVAMMILEKLRLGFLVCPKKLFVAGNNY